MRKLNLWWDDLSSEEASLIPSIFPNLESLDISWTQVDDSGLAQILKGCCNLKQLNITRCDKLSYSCFKEAAEFHFGEEQHQKYKKSAL